MQYNGMGISYAKRLEIQKIEMTCPGVWQQLDARIRQKYFLLKFPGTRHIMKINGALRYSSQLVHYSTLGGPL